MAAGYSMMDRRHNKDITELGIIIINYTIKNCQK
jgi:hypothetical protein